MVAEEVISTFKRDWENYKGMKAVEHPTKNHKEMLNRSAFCCISVQQYVAAFEETDWTIHPDIVTLASGSGKGMITTKPVEDVHNVQKNCGQAKGACKWRRPQRAMAVAIARKVLSKRHKYKEVPEDVMLNRKSLCLTAAAFGKNAGKPSLSTAGIATTSSKAPYFSPSPANSALPTIDFVCAEDMKNYGGDYSLAEKTFLGCFCDADHCIVFKRLGGVGPDLSWHVGLVNWNSSGCLAWPVELVKATPTSAIELVKFDTTVRKPTMLSMLSWTGVVGRKCEWQSWGAQVRNTPDINKHHPAAIRMVAVGGELSMSKLAASCAYWGLDNSVVRSLAAEYAMEVDESSSLLECCMHMTKQVMECSDTDAMAYLAQRLSKKAHKDYKAMQILTEVDDAAACLDHTDEQVVKDEKEKAKSLKSDYTSFREEYKVKRREVRAKALPKAAAAAGGKGKGRGRGAKGKGKGRSLPESMEMMEQRVVKTYMPPGRAWVWKQRSSNSWATRYGELPQISRSVQKYGETMALKIVLSNCWRDYGLMEGIPEDELDMGGLVEVDVPDLD